MTLERLIGIVEEFRKFDSEMQLQTVLVFLLTARNEGCSLQHLASLTGLSSAAVSRNVAALSELHRKGRRGHELITSRVDPSDRRNRRLHLTPKGRRVLASLIQGEL